MVHPTPADATPANRVFRYRWIAFMAIAMLLVCHRAAAQGADRFERGVVTVEQSKGTDVGPLTLTNGKAAPSRTTARVQWTADALLVQFSCEDKTVHTQVQGRDNPELWRNDCVEIFLDTGHAHDLNGDWIHLLVTADGQVMDQRGPVAGYFTSGEPENGNLAFDLEGVKVKTERTDSGWTAEVTIPWAAIGNVPKAGEVWGFNLGRENHPDGEYQTLFPTRGPFFRIDRWGHLAFTEGPEQRDATQALIDKAHDAAEAREGDRALYRERFEAHRNSPEQSWVEVNGVIYGAKADDRGPIGGGAGYRDVVTKGDHTVRSLAGLIDALAKVKAGEVIFIPGDVEIDVTEMIYTDKLVLKVPAGVTLASDRGVNGSPGAIIMSDAFATQPMILVAGDDVTIKGLRVRGPDTKIRNEHHNRAYASDSSGRDQGYYYKFPTSDGVQTDASRLTVANCEISGWSHGGVYLRRGTGHLVTHSHLHHNRRQGLGYGVSMDIAEVVIEYNLFSHNRHDIAATGRPGSGYVARHNIVAAHEAVSHHFDMHGGGDRKDGTNIAGDYIRVYNNSFFATGQPVAIRGAAQKEELIYHNWFPRHRPPNQPGDILGYSSRTAVRTRGQAEIRDNAYLTIHTE
jgi:hypothetical protein